MKIEIDSSKSYAVSKKPDFEFINENLRELLEKIASKHYDHVAYVFDQNGGLELTYGELRRRVETCAVNLLGLGVKKGDRLAFMLPYTVESLILSFSCAYIGVMFAPIDPWWCIEDLEYTLKKINPTALILMTRFENVSYYNLFREICPEVVSSTKGDLNCSKFPHLKYIILARHFENYELEQVAVDYSTVWDLDEILGENVELSSRVVDWPVVSSHDPIFMVYTSGTTGKKKASFSTFYKYINNAKIQVDVIQNHYEMSDFFENSCYAMSLNFVAGQLFGFLPALLIKARTVFPAFSRNIQSTLNAVSKYKCKNLVAAPKLLFDIFTSSEVHFHNLSSLKYVTSGSQAVSVDLISLAFKRCTNLEHVFVVYGMTEMLLSAMIPVNMGMIDKRMKLAGAPVGKPLPFFEFKVVDTNSNLIVPLNRSGELYTRGFSIFNGYWNDHDKTKYAIDPEGWLRTGDLVQMDEYGHIYFIYRRKEVIKFGDMLIIPSEIEIALRTHENVADANVFSITNSSGLDMCGCAWIILKDKRKNTSIEELKAIVGRKSIDYIKIVDDFPINENGKVVKTEMSRRFKIELNL